MAKLKPNNVKFTRNVGTAPAFYFNQSTSTDPYWDNVELLVTADAGYVDLSKNNASVGNYGTTITTNQQKFGSSFEITDNADRLLVSVPDEFYNYRETDFTWEGWYYLTDAGVVMGRFAQTTDSFMLYNGYWNSDTLYLVHDNASLVSAPLTGYSNKWTHIAVTCEYNGSSYVYRLFLDGVLKDSNTTTLHSSERYFGAFGIGSHHNNATYTMGGYADQIRVTKGVARYTSNFAVPTEAFPTSGPALP